MTLHFPLLKKDFENGAFICQETLRCDSYTFVICPRILPNIIMNQGTIPVEVDILLLFTIFSHPDGKPFSAPKRRFMVFLTLKT